MKTLQKLQTKWQERLDQIKVYATSDPQNGEKHRGRIETLEAVLEDVAALLQREQAKIIHQQLQIGPVKISNNLTIQLTDTNKIEIQAPKGFTTDYPNTIEGVCNLLDDEQD